MELSIDIFDTMSWRALEYAACFSDTVSNGEQVPVDVELYKLGVLRNELDFGNMSRAAINGMSFMELRYKLLTESLRISPSTEILQLQVLRYHSVYCRKKIPITESLKSLLLEHYNGVVDQLLVDKMDGDRTKAAPANVIAIMHCDVRVFPKRHSVAQDLQLLLRGDTYDNVTNDLQILNRIECLGVKLVVPLGLRNSRRSGLNINMLLGFILMRAAALSARLSLTQLTLEAMLYVASLEPYCVEFEANTIGRCLECLCQNGKFEGSMIERSYHDLSTSLPAVHLESLFE